MPPDAGLHLAEAQLLDGLERVLRAGKADWMLLVLHLSCLGSPRPHHRRMAAALLDEMAERCAGQLFGLTNGDLALLFRPSDEGAGVLDLITRLFGAEADIPALRSLWPLPAAAGPARHYVQTRARDPARADPVPDPTGNAATDRLLRSAPLPAVLARQTAVQLRAGPARRILPLFRELALGPKLLSASRPEGEDTALRASDMVARLEGRTLAGATEALRRPSPIASGLQVPLHLNLTPAGVMSDAFAHFAAACVRLPGLAVAIELPIDTAFADPATFIMARERLRLTNIAFVLDHVSSATLLASRPWALAPHWIKLDWTETLPDGGAALVAALERSGVDQIILAGCDTEAAVVWGLGAGLQRFQGSFVDAMLAAERLRRCPAASACSLLQCRLRAATLLVPDRALCRNHGLLDAATDTGSR